LTFAQYCATLLEDVWSIPTYIHLASEREMPHCEKGIIEYYDAEKGFGKIRADYDGKLIFFHRNNGRPEDDRKRLKEGVWIEFVRVSAEKGQKASEWRFSPYVSYSDVCHEQLGTTSQYGAHYIRGLDPTPCLGADFRFENRYGEGSFHSWRIHEDDVRPFVDRVKRWVWARAHCPKNVLLYVNRADRTYFFSSKWEQPDLPEDFEPIVHRLPEVVTASAIVPTGVIIDPREVTQYFYLTWREIQNPSPEFQVMVA
jgi:cold shock CspA family protein